MTFNKSLAVFGLLASVATPAAAFDISNFSLALDEARAKVSAWFVTPSYATFSGTPATTAAPTKSILVTTPSAPAKVAAPVISTPVASNPIAVAPVVAAPVVTAPAVTAPVVQPAITLASVKTTVPKSSAKVTNTKATFSWSEAAADASLGLLTTAFDNAATSAAAAAAAAKAAAEALAAETAAAAEALAAQAAAAAKAAADALAAQAAAAADAVAAQIAAAAAAAEAAAEAAAKAVADAAAAALATLTSPTNSANDLQAVLVVGSQPALETPAVSEPAPSIGTGTGSGTPADPGENTGSPSAPNADEVVGGNGTTYYVDFASGNDANSGKSTTQAWKRAPGDTASTANSAAAVLKGGDTVRFKGGIAYRGTIVLKQSGDVGNPIIYTGTGFGTGQAIWDGADSATSSVACPSQSACGGASNWQSLRLVTYTDPGIANRKLYDATGPLYESQSPAVTDPFWDDDLEQFVTIPVAQAAAVATGRLVDASLAAAASGQPNARIAIWIYGNTVVERKITSVSGSTIYFDATGVTPYTDRDGKAAIVGSVKSVTKPGLYAVIATGKAVLYPRPGNSPVFVGTGRYAFDLRGKSNITVHGFQFVRGTGSRGATREGVGIANYGSAVSNIRIENNNFSGYSMQNGYGMVMLNNVANLVVRNNRLTNLEGASGFRFGAAVSNLSVENNVMQKLGRTGIFLGGVKVARVSGNVLSQLSGVHGNGMSYYEANSDITVSGNCVFDTVRPLTFYGGGSGGDVNNLRFTGNIFVTSDDGRSAVYSWGAYTRQVVLDNNVALGTRAGFILHSTDLGVSATRNRTSGLSINGATSTPSGWTLQANDNSAAFADAASATLTPSSCSARGAVGTIAVGVS